MNFFNNYLDRKSFSITTTFCIFLIQIVILKYWLSNEQQQEYESVKIDNIPFEIAGCYILIIAYGFLIIVHLVKQNQICFTFTFTFTFISIAMLMCIGQIVLFVGTNVEFWQQFPDSKQVMRIISLIIFLLSFATTSLTINIDIISSRQYQQYHLFGAFVVQLLITFYFCFERVKLVNKQNSYDEQYFKIQPPSVISLVGSIIILVSHFSIMLFTYSTWSPLRYCIRIFKLLQFVGCCLQLFGNLDYNPIPELTQVKPINYWVLVEISLISILFCVIACSSRIIPSILNSQRVANIQFNDPQNQQI